MAIPKVVRRISVVLLLLASTPQSMGVPLLLADQMLTDQHIESRDSGFIVNVYAERHTYASKSGTFDPISSDNTDTIMDDEVNKILFGPLRRSHQVVQFQPSTEQSKGYGTEWDALSESARHASVHTSRIFLGEIHFPNKALKDFVLGSLRNGGGPIFQSLFVEGRVLEREPEFIKPKAIDYHRAANAMIERSKDLPTLCRPLLAKEIPGIENLNRREAKIEREKIEKLKTDLVNLTFKPEVNISGYHPELGLDLEVWAEYNWAIENYPEYKGWCKKNSRAQKWFWPKYDQSDGKGKEVAVVQ
ncbi:hypothetical protein FB446DRAFT_263573 [Lentinula raphanica]|nr:hypothetical protein FB446DRAFT_263573 [Lentinula raphanica]